MTLYCPKCNEEITDAMEIKCQECEYREKYRRIIKEMSKQPSLMPYVGLICGVILAIIAYIKMDDIFYILLALALVIISLTAIIEDVHSKKRLMKVLNEKEMIT